MIVLETREWAQVTFGACELGDLRRTRSLVRYAQQVALRPDDSTPEQTKSWADCQAAYRLLGQEGVTFKAIVAPHFELVRDGFRSGDVKLPISKRPS